MKRDNIQCGKYQHYKTKKTYKIISIARHTETDEEVVVYKALYGDGQVWVRPKEIFFADVFYKGRSIPRFKFIA